MNMVYAIKDRKTGLYYTHSMHRTSTGFWSDALDEAKFYKTEDGAQRAIDGKVVAPRVAAAMRKADPFIVPIQLTEMYSPQRVEPRPQLPGATPDQLGKVLADFMHDRRPPEQDW